ncbi:helix-turn-helix domain-containing protein [Heyndrickxia faecalis]|uniref:helix-turn-helix domain-containing protein n=1 Tax=Heyndrickxia faecalis TaxID=2824910 RepID=UPI003D1DB35A
MKLGKEMANARKRKGITQEGLASNTPVSRESIAKYETGARTFPDDLRSVMVNELDDVEFYFLAWCDAAGKVSIPYFNGENIDHHPTSMAFLVQAETNEALDKLQDIPWAKPVHTRTAQELEETKKLIFELLDAAASMVNLVGVICNEHQFSMKQLFTQWRLSLRSRNYIDKDF